MAIALLISSCFFVNNPTNYLFVPSITLEELVRQSGNEKNSYEGIKLAIKTGDFLPDETNCHYATKLLPPVRFDFADIERCFNKKNEIETLRALNTELYQLVAEEGKPAEHSYAVESIPVKNLFDSLSQGSWTFMCDGHSEVANKFISHYAGNRFVAKSAYIKLDDGSQNLHVVSLVYFRKNNEWFGSVFDCQNGMLGPVAKSDTTIPTLQTLISNPCAAAEYKLWILPDSVMHLKRVLMNEPLPCNLFPEKEVKYHLAQPGSGYRLERLAYSQVYYSWFLNGRIDLDNYTEQLITILIENSPEAVHLP